MRTKIFGLALLSAVFLTQEIIQSEVFADGDDYKIEYAAAKPTSYLRLTPGQLPCPSIGGGSLSDPLNPPQSQGIDHAKYGTLVSDRVESLSPADLGFGQVVAFEAKVCAKSQIDPNTEGGALSFSAKYDFKTSANDAFGYDENYGVYCAFIDKSDPANANLDGNENVTYTSVQSANKFNGNFTVTGLEANDCAVVEIWVALQDTQEVGMSGVVNSSIESAQTISGSAISGADLDTANIPLQAGQFISTYADVKITKVDSPDPVTYLGTLQYQVDFTNLSSTVVANTVGLVDFIDFNTTYQSVSILDSQGAPTTCLFFPPYQAISGWLTCDLNYLNPLEKVSLIINVKVTSPMDVTNVTPVSGVPYKGIGGPGPTCPADADICNYAVAATYNDNIFTNNKIYQPTAVLVVVDQPGLSIDKQASSISVDANDVVTYSYLVKNTGNVNLSSVAVTDDKCSPAQFLEEVSGNADAVFNPNETWKFTCSMVLTQTTTNMAYASALDGNLNSVVSDFDSVTVTVLPTPTPTATNTATRTATSTPTVIITITLTPTFTPTNTATATASNTATATASNTTTNTATNTASPTPSNTPTNTSTVTATNTSTNTATATATETSTSTATATATETSTNTATATATSTSTETATSTATSTATETATNTATATASETATNTATATATETATSTATATATETATNTATATETATATSTATATETATNTATATATNTATSTETPTNTPTPVATNTATFTPPAVVPGNDPVCSESDISAQLFALDGGARQQEKLIESVLRSLKRLAKNNSSVKSKVNKIVSAAQPEAERLANANWQFTWSIPKIVQTCEQSPFCVQTDLTPIAGNYETNNLKLNQLLGDVVKQALKLRAINKKASTQKIKTGDNLFNTNKGLINGIPKSNTTCIK